MTVAVEDTMCSTRIIENYKGEMIDEATFSSLSVFLVLIKCRESEQNLNLSKIKRCYRIYTKVPLAFQALPLIKGEKLVVVKK